MKFPFATGLLAQTLPTLSSITDTDILTTSKPKVSVEDPFPNPQKPNVQRYKQRRGLHAKRKLTWQEKGVLKNAGKFLDPEVNHDPVLTNADIGILSCSQGHACTSPSSHQSAATLASGGTAGPVRNNDSITNPKTISKGETLVQCDPTSVDIGILTCEEEEFCQNDPSSSIGGFCVRVPVSSSRRLNPMEDFYYSCEPTFASFDSSCDCSGLNYTTGTGTMYCLHRNTSMKDVYGCNEPVADNAFWMTFEEWEWIAMRDCYQFNVPNYESQGFCYIFQYPGDSNSTSYSLELNGERCKSVDYEYGTVSFDCSNVEGGTSGSSIVDLFPFFEQCYRVHSYTCTNLCGDGFYIPVFNYEVNVTFAGDGEVNCGILAYVETNALIRDIDCPDHTIAAQSGCCAPSSDLTVDETDEDSPTPAPTSEEASTAPDTSDGSGAHFECLAPLAGFAAATILLVINM